MAPLLWSTGKTVPQGVPAGTCPSDSSTWHSTLGILEECKQAWIEKHWARVGAQEIPLPRSPHGNGCICYCSSAVPLLSYCPMSSSILCFCPHSLLAFHSFHPSSLSLFHFLCFLSFKSLLHFSKYLNIPLLQVVSSLSQALTPS